MVSGWHSKAEAATAVSFTESGRAVHHGAWGGLGATPSMPDQWRATLATYAYPVIGDLAVAAVEVGHVLKILEPIWSAKTETGLAGARSRRGGSWIGRRARGYRTGDNPARWRGHWTSCCRPDRRSPRVKTSESAMPCTATYRHSWASCAIRIQPQRPRLGIDDPDGGADWRERSARGWDEIDLAAKVWTVPAGRTKAGREHRVPLSDRAARNPSRPAAARRRRVPVSRRAHRQAVVQHGDAGELLRGMDAPV